MFSVELRRRRHVKRRLDLINLGANACGALLFIFYSLVSRVSSLDMVIGSTLEDIALLITLLLLLGGALDWYWTARLWSWYLGRERTAGPPPSEVRRLALNQPAIAAGISLAMWVAAGLVLVAWLKLRLGWFSWWVLALNMSGFLVSGFITSVLVFFLNERVWHRELPFFMSGGELPRMPAFRLPLRQRILLLFMMQSIPLVLLAVIFYMHLGRIQNASQAVAILSSLAIIQSLIVGIGLLMAVILVLTLGATLVESIERLRSAMATAREGNLEINVPVISNDELGELAAGFNTMVEGLRRQEVVRSLFGRYVSPEVAEHAIEYGAELGGQITEASILFVDIRNFTRLAEQVEPPALIALLNRYFQMLSSIVSADGGLVNKYGGDSVLAIFGTPLNPTADHARLATEAAQRILAALETFNHEQLGRGEPELRVGMGVATGAVLAGNVGSPDRLEYTVIGGVVNLASRLQSLTKELHVPILLSEATAGAVQDVLPLEPVGEVAVRGRYDRVPVYTLRSLRSRAIERGT